MTEYEPKVAWALRRALQRQGFDPGADIVPSATPPAPIIGITSDELARSTKKLFEYNADRLSSIKIEAADE